MSWLFPQIPRPHAEQLIEAFNADPTNRRFSGFEHPQRFYCESRRQPLRPSLSEPR